jgi:hypothetical protein
MTRVFSILAAIVALAVSAAAASAGTPETAKGACHVPGFMDYTDDSCMAKPRWGSAPASALASRSGGEVVSDLAKSKPKPAGVYDHGITQGRKPPPRGTAGSTLIGEVTFPKARRAGVINSLGQKYTVSALVKNQNLAGNIKAKESSPLRLATQSGDDTITLNEKASTPRTLGAANDISHLSLRKAPPKPRGILDNPASGGF